MKFVELGVIFLFYFILIAHPEGLNGVDTLSVQIYGKLNEAGVASEDLLESLRFRKVLLFLL